MAKALAMGLCSMMSVTHSRGVTLSRYDSTSRQVISQKNLGQVDDIHSPHQNKDERYTYTPHILTLHTIMCYVQLYRVLT